MVETGYPCRSVTKLAGPVIGCNDDRRSAVGDRGDIVAAQGIGEERSAQQLVDARGGLLGVRAPAGGEAVQCHLRHLFGCPLAGAQPKAGL